MHLLIVCRQIELQQEQETEELHELWNELRQKLLLMFHPSTDTRQSDECSASDDTTSGPTDNSIHDLIERFDITCTSLHTHYLQSGTPFIDHVLGKLEDFTKTRMTVHPIRGSLGKPNWAGIPPLSWMDGSVNSQCCLLTSTPTAKQNFFLLWLNDYCWSSVHRGWPGWVELWLFTAKLG